jgi:hypothetical protein
MKQRKSSKSKLFINGKLTTAGEKLVKNLAEELERKFEEISGGDPKKSRSIGVISGHTCWQASNRMVEKKQAILHFAVRRLRASMASV